MMAKIRKRGNSYQIDYLDPTGKRVRKSFKKKKAVNLLNGLTAFRRPAEISTCHKIVTSTLPSQHAGL
jgi:hypothetical protein